MIASDDNAEKPGGHWDAEGDDLTFIRDEGLELLALYRTVEDPKKRRLIIDLLNAMLEEAPKR